MYVLRLVKLHLLTIFQSCKCFLCECFVEAQRQEMIVVTIIIIFCMGAKPGLWH
jgi:hypothetical protein